MAKCKVCGSRVPEGTEKCPMCGAKIQSNIERSKPQIVTSSVTPEVTDGKCKVCGSQIPDGAKFCPVCGSQIGNPKTEEIPVQNVQQTPAPVESIQPVKEVQPEQQYQPQQNNNYIYVETKAKKEPDGRSLAIIKVLGTIIGIFITLFVIFIWINDSFGSSGSSSTSQSVQKKQYAKIDVSDLEQQMNDFEFKAWAEVYMNNVTEYGLSTRFVAIPEKNITQQDKNVLIYVADYLRNNYQLEHHSTYLVNIYKYYNSPKDLAGWTMLLRYSKQTNDFEFLLIRSTNL